MLSCGALVAWTKLAGTVQASSSCPSFHTHGGFVHTAATSLTTLILVLHLVTRLRTSLSSFTFTSQTFQAPTALCAVLKLGNVAWNVLLARTTACVSQAACTAIRHEPSAHAAQVQFLTEPHTISTAGFSQHRANGNTPCLVFHAAPRRLETSAPSANDFQCFIAARATLATLPVEHTSVTFSYALDLFLRQVDQ